MLLQLVTEHPQALPAVLGRTPAWVWALLAGLLALGLSQTRARQASLGRVLMTPIAMNVLALYGVVNVFGGNGQIATVLGAWLAMAALAVAALWRLAPTPGTGYDGQRRQFQLVGSWWPLLLILGIFLTKYVVGVDTAMDPTLVRNSGYALGVCALYGLFSGVFLARARGLLALAYPPRADAAGGTARLA